MRSLSTWGLAGLVVSILILFTLVFSGFKPLSAETLTNVTITVTPRTTGLPFVAIQPIASNIQLLSPVSCVTQDYLNRYFGGSSQTYLASLSKGAVCTDGYVQANTLTQEIQSVSGSIDELSGRIGALDRTLAYLNSLSGIDGLTLIAIPRGILKPTNFETATNIQKMCLQNTTDNTKTNDVAVGTRAFDAISLFNGLPANQVAVLRKLEADGQANKADLEAKMAESAKRSKDGKSNLGLEDQIDLINKLDAAKQLIMANFIPLTTKDLTENYKNFILRKAYSGTSFAYVLDSNGKKQVTALPQRLVKLGAGVISFLNGIGVTKLTIPKIDFEPDDKLVKVAITFGDFTLPNGKAPEKTVLAEMKKWARAKKVEYENTRLDLMAVQTQLQKKLDALAQSGYNCN